MTRGDIEAEVKYKKRNIDNHFEAVKYYLQRIIDEDLSLLEACSGNSSQFSERIRKEIEE